MPLLPHQQAAYDKWVYQFGGIGVSKEVLGDALESMPEGAILTDVYSQCLLAQKRTGFKPDCGWQLVMWSKDVNWVKQPIKNVYKTTRDQFNFNLAHFAAIAGHADCFFAVMEKYGFDPKEKASGALDIVSLASISGNSDFLFSLIEKYGLDPAVRNYLARGAALSGNAACLTAVLSRYPELRNATNYKDVAIKQGINLALVEAQVNAGLVPEFRENILSGHANWLALLIQLKNICDQIKTQEAAVTYQEAAQFHTDRLTRLLQQDNAQETFATLQAMLAAGIKQVEPIVHQQLGQIAFNEAMELKAKIATPERSLLNFIYIPQYKKQLLEKLEKAKSYGHRESYYELAQVVLENKNLAFSYYYQGAKAGDTKSKNALRIAANDTLLLTNRFLGLLYSGLYLNDREQLNKAKAEDFSAFAAFAQKEHLNEDIPHLQRVLLLHMVELKREQVTLIKNQFANLKTESERMKYAYSLLDVFGGQRFAEMTIYFNDALALELESRAALLIVANPLFLTDAVRSVIEQHTKALPQKLREQIETPQSEEPNSNVASSSSSSSTSAIALPAEPQSTQLGNFGLFPLATPIAEVPRKLDVAPPSELDAAPEAPEHEPVDPFPATPNTTLEASRIGCSSSQ